jgi:hypothetical protein
MGINATFGLDISSSLETVETVSNFFRKAVKSDGNPLRYVVKNTQCSGTA